MSDLVRFTGSGVLPNVATGLGVVVLGAGIALALASPHHVTAAASHTLAVPSTTETSSVAPVTSSSSPSPSPVPAPVPVSSPVPASGPACWMLCGEPSLPPPDAEGCRLFCELSRPVDGGVR
jgi:hypothetical protein